TKPTTTPTTTTTTPTATAISTITTTTTTAPTTSTITTTTVSLRRTRVTVVFLIFVSPNLLQLFRRRLRNKTITIIILSLRRGSLIADFEIVYEDSEQSQAQFTEANIDLVTGRETVTILNETVAASSIQVNNTIVTNETSGAAVCALFEASGGRCDKAYECATVDGAPTCLWNDLDHCGCDMQLSLSFNHKYYHLRNGSRIPDPEVKEKIFLTGLTAIWRLSMREHSEEVIWTQLYLNN
ncbi:hypothetical protein MAR_023633, partial [Mya arenaria]